MFGDVDGDGLTYKWYFKNKYASEFTYTSSFTGAMYATTMRDSPEELFCMSDLPI